LQKIKNHGMDVLEFVPSRGVVEAWGNVRQAAIW